MSEAAHAEDEKKWELATQLLMNPNNAVTIHTEQINIIQGR